MFKKIKADLHIHTCLSPCGDIEMTPKMIIEKARSIGLNVIGICDHNSSENSAAVKKAGEENNLKVLSGMEVTSQEEVHILALFDDETKLSELQKIVYENLNGVNDEELFGYQMIVNMQDEIVDLNNKLLIGATGLTVDRIVELIHSLNGLAIASHVDRERFSLIGQLGFVPVGLELDGLELSPAYMSEKKEFDFPMSSGLPLVTFSDAHFINEIGKTSTTFLIKEITVDEIKKALENKDGRSVLAYS
ncbi:MAG: PHP domain-containing protein [Candidatus Delongbacteria bacterium]|nr:PHP domain-containing protein [Candidatus Delongbacteria bacterium]MCG2760093.1 PHP domain-containing protein [Candidatus Delongbacteria bacterium]